MNNKDIMNVVKKIQKNRICEIRKSMNSNDFETMFDGMFAVDYPQFMWELENDDCQNFADWLAEEGREEKLRQFMSALMYDDQKQLIFAATSPCMFCNKLLDEQYIEILNEMSTEQIHKLYRAYDEEGKEALIWRLQNDKWERFIRHIATLDGGMWQLSDFLLAMIPEHFEAMIADISCETLNLMIFSASNPIQFCNSLSRKRLNETLNHMTAKQIFRIFEEFGFDEEGKIDIVERLSDEKFMEIIKEYCFHKEEQRKFYDLLLGQEEARNRLFEAFSALEPKFQAQTLKNADEWLVNDIFDIVWQPELLNEFSETELIQLMLNIPAYRLEIFVDLAKAEYTEFWEKVPVSEQITFLKMAKSEGLVIADVFAISDFCRLWREADTSSREFLVFEILLAQGNVWVKDFYKQLTKPEKIEVLEMAYRPDESDDETRIKTTLASELKEALKSFEELEKYEKVFLEYFEKE